MVEHTRTPSKRLSFEDAIQIHQLIRKGWLQSRIAARFDVNGGRISEINTGRLHPGSLQAAIGDLEAKGADHG